MNRRAALITFGAAVVLLLMWFLLLWSPQGSKLSAARERTTAADTANEALQVRLQRLQAAQGDAPRLMAQLDSLRRAVPDDPQLAAFILDANDAASEADVDFLSISPGLPELGSGGLPPTIPLSINVTGEYFSVLDYLDRLDDLPRLVVIETIGLTPIGDDSGASDTGEMLSVTIVGSMFTTALPAQPGVPAAPAPTATTTTTAGTDAQQPVTTSTQASP
jgi:Tfp pilus assembly protein PilO